jgi:hypothetical protein
VPELTAVSDAAECATYYHHMIFATAWNISSDLMLLAIPFPIVFKTQLPLKRKIGLCCVLGLGALNASHDDPPPHVAPSYNDPSH